MTSAVRALVGLPAAAVAGWVFGLLIGSSPAPQEPGVVWAGQVAAPWLALPWLVGWVLAGRRGLPVAALAGAVAVAFAVHGYYIHWWRLSAETLELPSSTPWIEVYLTSTTRNLQFATIWYVLGISTGALMGFAGERFRQVRGVIAGAALAVPFVLEPVGQFLVFGRLDRPEWVWAVEAVLGLVMLAWVVGDRRRRTPAAEAHAA